MKLEEFIDSKAVQDIKNAQRNDMTVEISVTENCNCNCRYCFEHVHSGHKIDVEEQNRQMKLLLDLCRNFDPIRFMKLHIVFWGGEPMCNYRYIEKIIEQTECYSFVDYFMYTNGTLHESFVELLKNDIVYKNKHRFEMQLSYDGEPHHSLMRGDNSKKIFDTAHLLVDNGFEISFKATLSFDAISLFPQCWKSYEKLHDEFGRFANYSPTLDTTKKDITEEMLDEWKKVIIEVASYEHKFIKNHGYPLLSWFDKFITYQDKKLSCHLNNHLMICVNGDMFICHGCQYSQHASNFKLGNTKDISSLVPFFREIFPAFKLKEPKVCNECGAVFCNVCHVAQVNNDYIDDWTSCKTRNRMRCMFFKEFGKVYNALELALIDGNGGDK